MLKVNLTRNIKHGIIKHGIPDRGMSYCERSLSDEEIRAEKDRVIHEQVIFKGSGRVRDVATGPDGAIYIVLNKPGKVVRLTPGD